MPAPFLRITRAGAFVPQGSTNVKLRLTRAGAEIPTATPAPPAGVKLRVTRAGASIPVVSAGTPVTAGSFLFAADGSGVWTSLPSFTASAAGAWT